MQNYLSRLRIKALRMLRDSTAFPVYFLFVLRLLSQPSCVSYFSLLLQLESLAQFLLGLPPLSFIFGKITPARTTVLGRRCQLTIVSSVIISVIISVVAWRWATFRHLTVPVVILDRPTAYRSTTLVEKRCRPCPIILSIASISCSASDLRIDAIGVARISVVGIPVAIIRRLVTSVTASICAEHYPVMYVSMVGSGVHHISHSSWLDVVGRHSQFPVRWRASEEQAFSGVSGSLPMDIACNALVVLTTCFRALLQ